MIKKTSILFVIVLILLISIDCKKKTSVAGVDLEVTFSEENLSDNLITDVTFKWKTGKDFQKMEQDYNVFVHFWHNGNQLLGDDHVPEVGTSTWEPEKEYSYSRRIYIPTFIDEFDPDFKGSETLRLAVGFYSPYDASGKSKQDVYEEKLKISPPPLDTPEIIYGEGFYNLEINPGSFLKQWRWISKTAQCIIDNPHRDALLIIEGGVNLEILNEQKVTIKINDLTLDEFIPKESHFKRTFNIKKDMLGDSDEFYLTIETDKTFTPAETRPNSKDKRELGLQVSFIYFR